MDLSFFVNGYLCMGKQSNTRGLGLLGVYTLIFKMSFPLCQVHPNRKLQIICLSHDCQQRLTLQCMACLNTSTCMQHRWKIIQTFVQQVFEACETEQARYEKRVKPRNPVLEVNQQKIKQIINRIDTQIDEAKKRIMSHLQDHSTIVLRHSHKEPELHFKTVKDNVNSFRRSQLRELTHLNTILKTLDPMLNCDETGVLTLKPIDLSPQVSNAEAVEEALVVLQETADRILHGLEGITEKKQTKDEFDKEREQLYAHIEELNQQIKQIPVLKQRIEDQALKLQAKNRKITQYQQQLTKSGIKQSIPRPSTSSSSLSTQDLLQKLQSQSQWRSTRIQKLLEIRQVVSKSAFNHCLQCTNDAVKYIRVHPQDDALNMDIGVSYCETAALINFCTIIIADELNALGFSEQVGTKGTELQWISMAVIAQKVGSPLKKKHSFGKNSHYTRNYY